MGLRECPIFFLQFGEQAHILDGDDGLVGKGLEKRDLAVREEFDLGAADPNGAKSETVTN
jgi:hypothetical protein